MTEELVALLLEKKMTVTTAESCTGGLIAATLISVPGVSACLNETLVTYANESKHKRLGVSEETLNDLLSIDTESWKADISNIREFYGLVGDRVPTEMKIELAALEKRLG